jgi:integrase
MLARITKRTVDALKPGSTDRFLWDTELKGFGLKVTPAGSKVYLLQYRRGGRVRADSDAPTNRWHPTKRVTIGRHGALTPEQAREKARTLSGAVTSGGDPAALVAAEKRAPSVADLAQRFLAEHVATKTKPRTGIEYRRIIDNIIVPAIGNKRVRDVTRSDISRLHHAHHQTPYAANRTLAILSKMFTLAEKWGERPDGSNPCRHVEKYGEVKRERMLSAEEFGRLAETLRKPGHPPYVVAAIKLLIFTGARLSEVLGLRWEWVDFDRGEARLPDSKTGAKTLHLPAPALAVLADLHRIEGNPFVIVGHIRGAHLVNIEKPWRAIRKAAALDNVRLHDLRHAFASVAASSGMGLPIIGKMLGHTQAATTHRYAHLASDPVKAAATMVAGHIAAAMGEAPNSAGEVVQLKKSPD